MIYHNETTCRSCGAARLETILSFGETPLADRLLTAEQLDKPEYKAPLTLAFCQECSLAQIVETVDPTILFYAEYPYFSSVSPSLLRHFAERGEGVGELCGVIRADLLEDQPEELAACALNFARDLVALLCHSNAHYPAVGGVRLTFDNPSLAEAVDQARHRGAGDTELVGEFSQRRVAAIADQVGQAQLRDR